MALGAEVFRLFGSIGVDTSEAEQSLDSVARTGRNTASDLNNTTGSGLRNFGVKSAAIMGAIAGAAQAAFNKVASIVTSTISSAVSRVDTLNNANLVFKNMGFSADDTKVAMTRLKDSILGLPTALNDAVTGVETLASSSGNLKQAQQVFSAINDGVIAFGGSTAMVNGAIQQLSQLPMDGPLDATTWDSLMQNGLTPVLSAIAKDAHISMGQLKNEFGSGKLTVADFNDMLIKMDKEGGGGMASLSKQAHDATSGIATGWANMQTAITRGLADIIQAIGSKNISNAISSIGTSFEKGLKDVSNAVTFIEAHKGAFSTLAVAIGSATAAFVLFNTYIKVSTALTAAYTAVSSYLTLVQSLQAQGLGGLRAAWLGLSIAMDANPIGIIITAVAALVAALVWFFTQTTLGKEILSNFFKFMTEAWTNISNFTSDTWRNITKFITDAWNSIKAGVDSGVNTVKDIVTNVTNTLKAAWDAVWNGVLVTLKFVWEAIKAYLTLTVGIPLAIINTFFIQPLLTIWNALWPYIQQAFETVWNAMAAFITPIINTISTTITTVINALKAWWDGVWNGIKDTATMVWSILKAAIEIDVNIIKNIITAVVTALKTWWDGVWNGIKDTVSTVWGAIKSAVDSAVNFVKSIITSTFNSVHSTTTSVWNGIYNAIKGPMESAANFVQGIVNAIRGFFNFRISWPHIPLPHFSLQPRGWSIGDLLKGKIPSLGIDWYAKGGILDGPTLFGLNGNNLMGGGEAGKEAVLPLNRDTLGGIGHGIAATMGAGNDSALLKSLLDEVKQLRKDQANTQLVMDTGALVGAIRKEVDKQLQNDSTLRLRGVTT